MFVPFLGFGLYLVWRKTSKVDARSALFGAIACILFFVFFFMYGLFLGFSETPYYY
jgi:EamA domain-containing membrane protein RarD